jgi:hypothetical protein
MTTQPLIVGVAALVAGLLLGLLYAWVLAPVEIVDTDFSTLRSDLKQEYVRLVAASYALDLDAQKAGQRVTALGSTWPTVVQETAAAAEGQDAVRLTQLSQVLDALQASGQISSPPAATGGGFASLLLPLGVACLVVVLLAGGGFLFLRSRTGVGANLSLGRAPARRPVEPMMEAEMPAAEAAEAVAGAQPIQRFLTTYTLGDDVYDDSFSVDGPDGNFLGECGMGISETIGVGDPKKVTAFEVWLFDKNDIRTVTKVIMSEHAFRDEALKSRLAAKGEPVQAQAGDTVVLETATLKVTARVVDMAYGGGALPPNSFFERMTIELQAYRKAAAA